MTYWQGAARWINGVLLVVVGVVGVDTLFRLLGANPDNLIVGGVRAVADLLVLPFADMFAGQGYLVTALMAVVAYCLLAGVVLAVLRAVQGRGREREPAGSPARTARTGRPGGERGPDRDAGA